MNNVGLLKRRLCKFTLVNCQLREELHLGPRDQTGFDPLDRVGGGRELAVGVRLVVIRLSFSERAQGTCNSTVSSAITIRPVRRGVRR